MRQGYGYSVNQLNSLLLTLFERYSELLQRKFSGDFEQIVLDDDHQSMVVNDGEEFEKVVSVSWLPSTGEWSANELKLYVLPFSPTPLTDIGLASLSLSLSRRRTPSAASTFDPLQSSTINSQKGSPSTIATSTTFYGKLSTTSSSSKSRRISNDDCR